MPHCLPLRLIPVLAVGLFGSLAHAQGVLRVDDDPGPGVDFTDLQSAIDASPSGGLVLVAPGSYGGFTLLGKSLDLIADAGPAGPPELGVSRIEGLGPDQQVRLSGLRFSGDGAPSGSGTLNVELCEGPVLVERCAFVPTDEVNVFGAVLQYGLFARRADRLVVSNSVAGRAVDVANLHGIYVRKSTAALFDCATVGGQGIAANDGFPGATGDESTFTVAGGSFAGGLGAPSFTGVFGGCTGPGDGAAGLSLEGEFGSLSTGWALGFEATGGLAGVDIPGTCPPAFDGPEVFSDPFSLLQLNPFLEARSQDHPPVAAAGDDVTLELSGEADDLAWLLVSTRADLRPAEIDFGATPLAVGANPLIAPLGALDAAGSLVLDLATPLLPPGAAVTLVTQPVLADSALKFVLGNPLTLTLLGPGL